MKTGIIQKRILIITALSLAGVALFSRILTFAEAPAEQQKLAEQQGQPLPETSQVQNTTDLSQPPSAPPSAAPAPSGQGDSVAQVEAVSEPNQSTEVNQVSSTQAGGIANASTESEKSEPEASPQRAQAEDLLVSLDFKEAEIADVLSALAKAYGLNIIAGKDITGKVSVSLKDVSLENALDSILALNKYAYTREGNIITIVSENQSQQTEVLELEFAEAGDVSDLFKNVLSETGDLKINEKMNELIITDVPSAIKKAKDLLYQVDSPPPQVIIEAKLVDVDPKDLTNFGADLDLNYSAVLSEGTHAFNLDYNLPGPSGSLSGDDVVSSWTTPLFTPANTFTVDSLLQKTKANLLSAPRIAVLNNQAAKIVIGEKVGIREQTQTASGTIESVRFVDVGITLKVTPTINRAGYVTMEITTEVSSISSFVDNLPRITTREASTFVRVPDRETIVIAGLLKDEYSETASSFPFLTHIPLFGQLLGNFANSRETKELVIFLTPHIILAADRVNPEDKAALERQIEERDSVGVIHEELVSPFRKNGIKDALDLPILPHDAIKKNFFERAEWFETTAKRKYNSRKFRTVQHDYFTEAAQSYKRFAEANPNDPRADDALRRSAELYESKVGNLPEAYDVYRNIVTEQPASRYADNALRQLERLKKKIDSTAKTLEKKQKSLHERLRVIEVTTEDVGNIKHGEIPVSGT